MSTTSSQSSPVGGAEVVKYRVQANYFLFPPSIPGFECGGHTAGADLGEFDFPILKEGDRRPSDSAWDDLTKDAERRVLESWEPVLDSAEARIPRLSPAFGGWTVTSIRFETNSEVPVRLLRARSTPQGRPILVPRQ